MTTGQKVGACRRKGFKSIIKDEWQILDAEDHVIGHAKEDSWLLAVLRRLLSSLIPQHYHLWVGEQCVGMVKGTWNPFIVRYHVNFDLDEYGQLDPRLGLAMMILLMTIEGKQG